jgi:uncharacterized membrane protein YagU involved in acid resistance
MPRHLRIVVLGGLVVGVLDIADAIVVTLARGGAPGRMLQGIASGLLGRETALAGGTATAALGLALHFFIALTVTVVYYAAALALPALHRRPFVFGPLYGVAVWLVMNFVVIPLSAIGRWPALTTLSLVNGLLFAHVFLVGIPAAVTARLAARAARAAHAPREAHTAR